MQRRKASTENTNHRGERGNALVEFALVWSVLWALFAGVYQFGYSMYVYNSLMISVSNAAQLGSKLTYDVGNPSAYTNAITNMAVYGDTTAGSTPIVPGLSTANVTVSVNPAGQLPTDLTVTIVNYRLDAIFTTFTFNGKPRAAATYMGRIMCSNC